jgi:hypothetical protein
MLDTHSLPDTIETTFCNESFMRLGGTLEESDTKRKTEKTLENSRLAKARKTLEASKENLDIPNSTSSLRFRITHYLYLLMPTCAQ